MDMLKKSGIVADECHSTADRIMNYTYIHLPKKCRIATIEKFFISARSEHGIVKNDVYGYDCIGSSSRTPGSLKLQEHIVFKMLVAHSKEKNPAFSPCTDGHAILSRGLLFEAQEIIEDGSASLESRTKSQLVNYAHRLQEKLKEFEEKKRQLAVMTDMYMEAARERTNLRLETNSLRRENASLKRKIEAMPDMPAENESIAP